MTGLVLSLHPFLPKGQNKTLPFLHLAAAAAAELVVKIRGDDMAQREKKETELRAPESLTLCVNNCGFSGNPATNNMCQSCFQSSTASSGAGGVAPPGPPPSCSPRTAAIRSSDLLTQAKKEAEEEEDAPKAVKEDPAAAAPARQVNRCSGCRKRVGLAGFRCRCGGLFCGDHRYSDRHDCSFDYKAAGRTAIARQNPVVRASKIVRI